MKLEKIICIAALLQSVSQAASPHIAIIGAGLAGLTTAYKLAQEDLDVHVYEARNRVGGRIFSASVNGHLAELGGQNIYDGGDATTMKTIAAELNLPIIEHNQPMNVAYIFNHEIISTGKIPTFSHLTPEELYEKIELCAQTSQNMLDVLDQLFDAQDPFKQLVQTQLNSYEGEHPAQLSTFYTSTLFYILLGGLCHAHQDSAIIKRASIQGGNYKLPVALQEYIGADRVHLNMPVEKIQRQNDNSYRIFFKDQTTVTADIVVLAVPAPLYQDIIFENNAIPDETLDIMRTIRCGGRSKIIVPIDTNNHRALITQTCVFFFNNDNHLINIYNVTKNSEFSEKTIEQRYNDDLPYLQLGFPETTFTTARPVMARDEQFASYDGVVGMSWPCDQYAKGAYSYIAAGQDTYMTEMSTVLGEQVKTLFAPINNSLFFTGEHTSILLDVSGTMEAACESGDRTARMITKALEQKI